MQQSACEHAALIWIRSSNTIRARGMIAPHTRPDTCQHPMTRRQQLRNYLLRKGRLYMLHKSDCDRISPLPGQTYPAGTVTGMPREVYRLSTAMRIWISATCRSKFLDIKDWPRSLMQFILLSTWLRRWYLLHFRQMARPRYRDALTSSLRATDPALERFHGLAFLRSEMTACARRAAIASWYFRVS